MRELKHIAYAGVELEGAFHFEDEDERRFHEDGSVNYDLCCGDECCFVGEVSSSPKDSLAAVRRFVRNFYPEHVDGSCGLHVHLSTFSPATYSLLTHRAYHDGLLSSLYAYGKEHSVPDEFFERLGGQNAYCERCFNPDGQLYRDDSRYTAVNYAAYRCHGTLELRVLPAFDYADDAYDVVEHVLTWTNSYIDARLLSASTLVETAVLALTNMPHRERTVIQCA